MTKINLKGKLRPGDIQTVAEATGFSTDYVRAIIKGRRKPVDSVLKAIARIFEQREELKKEFCS